MCDCEDDADRAAREDTESYEDSFCYIIKGITETKCGGSETWIANIYKGIYNGEIANQRCNYLNSIIDKYYKEKPDRGADLELQKLLKEEDLSVPNYLGEVTFYEIEVRTFDY